MNCCQCQGIERVFDTSTAIKDLKRYQKKGATKTTQKLLDTIKGLGKTGLTLVDVGGGVGIIQHELLQAGVAQTAVHIDAAKPYLQISQEEAERRGHGDRVTYQYGNFVELAADLEPSDLVTLDRVICCYHDMPGMVSAAAGQAQQYIAFVFPRDTWWIKVGANLPNIMLGLFSNPFRIFIHSTAAVDQLLQQHGFERQAHTRFLFWQSMLYKKRVVV